jgi:hypothetical protein
MPRAVLRAARLKKQGRNIMAKTPAQSARAILHIIVSGGTKANEIIMCGEVERAFLEIDPTSTPQEFVEGLNYAKDQGWLTSHDTRMKLTQPGYQAAK